MKTQVSLFSNNSSQRALELRNLLNKANHAYYVLDEPLMEDSVYDNFYNELLSLEKKDSSLITADSPSQRIGGSPAKSFKSKRHKIPLFSLDNAFNIEEVSNWYSKMLKLEDNPKTSIGKASDMDVISELKIDGNALALSYENGILVQALTRGNGEEGEDITSNVRTISSIPLSLHLKEPPSWLEVRGEAFMPNKVFDNINNERRKTKNTLFANPRNACAGTLRQLNPQIVAARKLDFFAYTLHLPTNWEANENDPQQPINQWQALQWLKTAGFKVNPNSELIHNLQGLYHFFNHWQTSRLGLDYATDGVVVKVNSFTKQKLAGFTQKAPRWALALKYAAEEAPSKLIKLTYQVGRTGAVTPVAEFEPVVLAGTSVSRATLHNANRLNELDLHLNDTIVIRKAGEIIPEVVRVVQELRVENNIKVELPLQCPECKSKLSKIESEAVTRCINDTCPAILRGLLKHWVSKKAMNIEGIGEKIIAQLVEQKIVNSIADLYSIRLEEIASLEKMGDKSAKKLLVAISKSKEQSWHRQLYGLGINHVGEANAKLLAKNFPSIEDLAEAVSNNTELISPIYGIGNETTQSLQEWFANPLKQKLINRLKVIGLSLSVKDNITADTNSQKNLLNSKIFVITGKMPTLSRHSAQEIIEKAGGKVNSSISKRTDYLIAGEKAGSKLNKAKALGIKVIDEEGFRNLVKE